jgi:N-acyl homoserine lactone hydrolase
VGTTGTARSDARRHELGREGQMTDPTTVTPVLTADFGIEAGSGGRMPVYVHLIDHKGTRILVDTGIKDQHPALFDMDPRLRAWTEEVDLASIDVVVNTHLHADHCGGNYLFESRPVYVQRRELDDALSLEDYTLHEWVEAPGVRYTALDGETELVPGIRLLPAPGHTDGSQIVVVDSGEQRLVIAGDTAVWFGELDEPTTEGQRLIATLRPDAVWLSHEHLPWKPST